MEEEGEEEEAEEEEEEEAKEEEPKAEEEEAEKEKVRWQVFASSINRHDEYTQGIQKGIKKYYVMTAGQFL